MQRRLGGPQSEAEYFREAKSHLSLPGFKPTAWLNKHTACRLQKYKSKMFQKWQENLWLLLQDLRWQDDKPCATSVTCLHLVIMYPTYSGMNYIIPYFVPQIFNASSHQYTHTSNSIHLHKRNKIHILQIPGVPPPLLWAPGGGGLFSHSLIWRQFSSSLSVFGSCYNKKITPFLCLTSWLWNIFQFTITFKLPGAKRRTSGLKT